MYAKLKKKKKVKKSCLEINYHSTKNDYNTLIKKNELYRGTEGKEE